MAKVKIWHYGVGPQGKEDGPIYGVGFICPGCGQVHVCPTEKYHSGNDAASEHWWGFNDNFDQPTFTPSLLWRSGHYAHPPTPEHPYCWHNPAPGVEPKPEWCYQCHSFVTDGRIQFLGDCSHSLASQTVELPEIE